MKTLFSNKHKLLLIKGGISLLVISIVVSIFTGSPPGTYAQKSGTQPPLGTTKTAFSDFCYDQWAAEQPRVGLNCLRHSKKALQLLQQVISPDSFAKWPQQASLSDLASQNLLVNPQTKAPIKTKEDFLAAIPPANRNLQALFKGDQGKPLLSALWTYKRTPDNAPPPPPPPVPVSGQPPSCPVSSQTFLHTDVWSVAGPLLLTATDQALQNQDGRRLGIYDIYGRLLLQHRCSIATLAQTMKLNGQPVTKPDQISQWERDVLVTTAINNSSNTKLMIGLISIVVQPDNALVNSWFSAAIITHPITSLTTSTAPSTSGVPPVGESTPTDTSPVHVQVS